MQEVYRLLRNNKERGPFSIEELVALELTPTDLVWVENKSTSWEHPLGIASLQPYLTKVAPTLNENELPAKESVPLEVLPVSSGLPLHHQHVHVQFPEEPPESSSEDFTRSANLDKKAEELYQRALAYTNEETSNLNKETIVPKYARSLDEIKEEYVSWRSTHRKKNKRVHPSIAVAAILMLIGMVYGTKKLLFNNETSPGNYISVKKAVVLADHKANHDEPIDVAVKKNHDENALGKRNDQANQNNYTLNSTPDQINAGKKVLVTSPSYTAKTPQINNPGIPHALKKVHTVEQVTDPGMAKAVIPSPNNVSLPRSVPATQMFTLYGIHPASTKKGIEAFKLTITNNSAELRFAAVDIVYKNNDGEIAGKETLYFKRIAPHQSMTLLAPGNQNADHVSYKLGLVSSEDGSIYYAQQ